MPEPARESPWTMFARQLTHLLALLLWVGAALALLAGMPELSVAIIVIVAAQRPVRLLAGLPRRPVHPGAAGVAARNGAGGAQRH